MMGCFDGVAPDADAGSTAELARWLGAPVVLVLDASGQARSVAAVVHGFERFDPELEGRRLTLGYADVRFSSDTPLGAAGTAARGHEFHASTLAPVPATVRRVYEIRGRGGESRVEGFLIDNALLSYVHLHFGSNPDLAPRFVDACARATR
jgi:cobyrinic acid a,c-diamide synthase